MTGNPCQLCVFWQDEKCTLTFKVHILAEPGPQGVGGQVVVEFVPGMVPEELKDKVGRYFHRFFEKALPALSMAPVWDEVREYQLASPERQACPGRKERTDLKPYLKIVKFERDA